MGITSSLITGLSGLSSNQAQLDVIGNNIANVNTVGYKSSQMEFKSQFSQNFSLGSAPNGDLGGTNPQQVGMGVTTGSISRNFNDGSRDITGVNSNLAMEGPGFFVLRDPNGQFFTRDGSFLLNSLNQLVSANGQHVEGFGIDSNYNVVPGVLQDITVPIGSLTVADATTSVSMTGNLNTGGPLPTQVSDLTMNQPLYVSDGAGGVTGTAPTSADLLTNMADGSGNLYFNAGDTLTMGGTVGSRSVAAKTLTVTSTTTLGDLQSFMSGSLGINTGTGANGSIATTPGVSLATGGTVPAGAVALTVDGNPGTANDIALNSNSLSVTSGSGTTMPFSWTKNATADGESIATSTTVYDSLGTAVNVNLVASLISRSATGATWQYYATSPDGASTGANLNEAVGMGTMTFDTSGHLVSTSNNSVNIDRTGTGATPNLLFNLDFSGISALSDTSSSLASNKQDGLPKGTLTNYQIETTGIIKGSFSNGASRTLGQIAVASFRNDQGLIDNGNNTWQAGPNSGTAVISAPGEFNTGHVVSGALELSNVDLSSEFVKLISASTGFSASSRVITTSNQLLQELLSAAR